MAGLGIGIALQGVLSNVIAGLTIIFTKPFRVGEHAVEGELYRALVERFGSAGITVPLPRQEVYLVNARG